MADASRDRARLIDHFKRLYSIIVGLAITDGCRKLLPYDPSTFSFSSLWIFLALFVTVVPLFQGGDRSLDRAYLDERSDKQPHNRFAYLWDVYMLLLTAIAFAVVAESIPPVGAQHGSMSPLLYFNAMALLLLFDVCVLLIGFLKERQQVIYIPWIAMNAGLGIAFYIVAQVLLRDGLSVATAAFLVFIAASLRTGFDYWLSKDFMF